MPLQLNDSGSTPDVPVEDWGFPRLLAAVQHGTREDWHRISLALEAEPRGKVAAELDDVLEAAWPSAVADALRRVRFSSLVHREAMERAADTTRLQGCFAASGLSVAEFAARLGTIEARMSTYLGGMEAPPHPLLVRAQEMVA